MYQVDAFADKLFKGNPAAVCLLDEWLPDEIMLKIAIENNLAETAFCIEKGDHYELRWFTPEVEIDLCGHATLATSHVLWAEEAKNQTELLFRTKRGGDLTVKQNNGLYELNFPSRPPEFHKTPEVILEALGKNPLEMMKSRDYFLVYESESQINEIIPDQKLLATIDDSFSGIIITSPGEQVDFVSRFFTPGASVFEDPVTGSAHCTLIPYWADKLNKKEMIAHQNSPRGGTLNCELNGERVLISGSALTFFKGSIYI